MHFTVFTVQSYGQPILFTVQLNTAFFYRAIQRGQGLEHSLNALKNTRQRLCCTLRISFLQFSLPEKKTVHANKWKLLIYTDNSV